MKPYLKDNDINGPILRRMLRFLGGELALRLKGTRITPNQLTIFSFLLSVISLPLLILRVFPFALIAAALNFIALVLDYADGSLARMQGTQSSLGNWLDSSLDFLRIFLIFVAMGASLHLIDNYPLAWLWVALAFFCYTGTKLLYLVFRKYFTDGADSVISDEKKHTLRANFYYNELLVSVSIITFSAFGAYLWMLMFLTAYGLLFYIVNYLVFTKHAVRLSREGKGDTGK